MMHSVSINTLYSLNLEEISGIFTLTKNRNWRPQNPKNPKYPGSYPYTRSSHSHICRWLDFARLYKRFPRFFPPPSAAVSHWNALILNLSFLSDFWVVQEAGNIKKHVCGNSSHVSCTIQRSDSWHLLKIRSVTAPIFLTPIPIQSDFQSLYDKFCRFSWGWRIETNG